MTSRPPARLQPWGTFMGNARNAGRGNPRARQPSLWWVYRAEAPKERRLERAKGIEPSYTAWEAVVLPLNYARDRRLSKAASFWPRLQRASATEIRHTFLIRTAFRCNGRHAGLSAG